MKTRSYTRGKGGLALSTASVAQHFQCIQSMCVDQHTYSHHHHSQSYLSKAAHPSLTTPVALFSPSSAAKSSAPSAASSSHHNSKLVYTAKRSASAAIAIDGKHNPSVSSGNSCSSTESGSGSASKPSAPALSNSSSPSATTAFALPPAITLQPPVLSCGCVMGSAAVKPKAATSAAIGTTSCGMGCTAGCLGGGTAGSVTVPGLTPTHGSTSAISATAVAGSTSTIENAYQVKSHYPPFTDPQIKKLAEQFLSTVNAHSYGYTAITTVTRIDTVHNGVLSTAFDQKRAEFTKLDVDHNEVMAFHGTPREANIDSISRGNFDSKRLGQTTGNQGWYGSGVYLTQHAGAALRYQYWNTSTPPERMLICRVLLGRVFTVPENSCDYIGKGITPGHHSHRGRDRWDADWQIVVFDSAQILPFAHVHYR